MVTGCPDHRFDIFPALITSPAPASIRCSSEALQMSRCAAASRRSCSPPLTPKPPGDAAPGLHPGVLDMAAQVDVT